MANLSPERRPLSLEPHTQYSTVLGGERRMAWGNAVLVGEQLRVCIGKRDLEEGEERDKYRRHCDSRHREARAHRIRGF